MKTIHAIYQNGVFRPKGLPENSQVEFEPRVVAVQCQGETRRRIRMRVPTNPKRKGKNPTGEPTFVGEHLVVDPRVCHGELTFRDTRIPVETVLRYLANGYSLAYLRKSWPEVSAEAIQEAVHMASAKLVQHYRGKKP